MLLLSRLSRWLCCSLILLLSGCSSLQLAYNNAPLLAQYQFDRYFDLNDEQEQRLKTELAQLHNWHQRHVLPEYAQKLRQWAQELNHSRNYTPEEILLEQQTLQKAVMVFATRAANALAPVLQTLGEREQRQLLRRFEASNREYQNDFVDNPARAATLRQERFIKNYERWLGPLTAQQQAQLSDWLETHPNHTNLWAEERLARQAALLEIIQQAPRYPSRQAAATVLTQYFQMLLMQHQTPAMQRQRASREQALAALTAELLNAMTPSQRQHLQQSLIGYANDFEALARRASTSP